VSDELRHRRAAPARAGERLARLDAAPVVGTKAIITGRFVKQSTVRKDPKTTGDESRSKKK
jgi:hypothetical protein